jgi:bifunctional non-homologous end joining protein LigD
LFELKWDGFRAIAETDAHGEVALYSRNHNDFKKRFPVIAEVLAELKRPAILDGAIVALDARGFPHFEWLVNRGKQKGTLVYYVFDLLSLDGTDWRWRPLIERKKRLSRLVDSLRSPCLMYVDHFEDKGRSMFGWVLGMNMEGMVAKDRNSRYRKVRVKMGIGRR